MGLEIALDVELAHALAPPGEHPPGRVDHERRQRHVGRRGLRAAAAGRGRRLDELGRGGVRRPGRGRRASGHARRPRRGDVLRRHRRQRRAAALPLHVAQCRRGRRHVAGRRLSLRRRLCHRDRLVREQRRHQRLQPPARLPEAGRVALEHDDADRTGRVLQRRPLQRVRRLLLERRDRLGRGRRHQRRDAAVGRAGGDRRPGTGAEGPRLARRARADVAGALPDAGYRLQ